MILNKEQQKVFAAAVQPLMQFLSTLHPHINAYITAERAELSEGLVGCSRHVYKSDAEPDVQPKAQEPTTLPKITKLQKEIVAGIYGIGMPCELSLVAGTINVQSQSVANSIRLLITNGWVLKVPHCKSGVPVYSLTDAAWKEIQSWKL